LNLINGTLFILLLWGEGNLFYEVRMLMIKIRVKQQLNSDKTLKDIMVEGAQGYNSLLTWHIL
jgi:hypothetical protein